MSEQSENKGQPLGKIELSKQPAERGTVIASLGDKKDQPNQPEEDPKKRWSARSPIILGLIGIFLLFGGFGIH